MNDVDLDALIERLQKLGRDMDRHAHPDWDEHEDVFAAVNAITELRRAPVSAGKVKALVWHDCTDGTSHDDDCQYEIEQQGKHWRVIRAVTGGTSYLVTCNSREAAKAAAQADYETRILSALQPGDGWQGIESLDDLREAIADEERTLQAQIAQMHAGTRDSGPREYERLAWAAFCRITANIPPDPPASLPQGEETR